MTRAVKERPILFSAPMVRSLLDGTKTQTRRIMKPQPQQAPEPGKHWWPSNPHQAMLRVEDEMQKWTGLADDCCPFGRPGDHLWVRETWAQPTALDPGPTFYRADYPACAAGFTNLPAVDEITWKPSIHMFRKDSRILLEVVSVRVERLQDISEQDAIAEGVEPNWCGDLSKGPNGFGGQGWVPDCGWINYLSGPDGEEAYTARESYETLWEFINGAGTWSANPWVWVVEFKRAKEIS